jgi:prolyl-tRNA editing enzyme YbaK/EbsC (Cys-tRNA(Pro) deacylase)
MPGLIRPDLQVRFPTAGPAVHFLRRHGIAFTEHPYRYEDRGGARVSARELGVAEHAIVKTLVMEDGATTVDVGLE